MGKTVNRQDRKKNEMLRRKQSREFKELNQIVFDEKPKREKPRQKWRPHSEINEDDDK